MSNYRDKNKDEDLDVIDVGQNKKEKREEEQPKKVKNLKSGNIAKKIFLGTTLVLAIGGCCIVGKAYFDTRPVDINKTTTKVVSLVSDESTIDEVCAIVNSTACSDMDELKEKVELSEKLHELDLDKYTEDLDEYEIPESYTVEEVEDLIDTFEDYLEKEKVKNGVLGTEDREATKVALTLKSYETLVNADIDVNSYNVLANSLIALVKAKTLDACSFDADEVNNMIISIKGDDYFIDFTDSETGKSYDVEICNSNLLTNAGYIGKVVANICYYQDAVCLVSDDEGVYNAEKNNSILEGINMFNTLALMDCEITDNGTLKVVNNMNDVKVKIKTLTSSETTN